GGPKACCRTSGHLNSRGRPPARHDLQNVDSCWPSPVGPAADLRRRDAGTGVAPRAGVKPEPELGPWARAWGAARRRGRQAARLLRWAVEPRGFPPPLVASGPGGFPHRVFEARVPLFGPGASGEPLLEAGKRTNVALAAPAFDGVVVTPWR